MSDGAQGLGVPRGTFTVERTLDAPPDLVARALVEPELRRRWVRMPGPRSAAEHEVDVREGGREHMRTTFAAAGVDELLEYDAVFLHVDLPEALRYAYRAKVDGTLRWVALAAITLAPDGDATLLTWTEHYELVRWDGTGEHDAAHLLGSTRLRVNGLASVVDGLAG